LKLNKVYSAITLKNKVYIALPVKIKVLRYHSKLMHRTIIQANIIPFPLLSLSTRCKML